MTLPQHKVHLGSCRDPLPESVCSTQLPTQYNCEVHKQRRQMTQLCLFLVRSKCTRWRYYWILCTSHHFWFRLLCLGRPQSISGLAECNRTHGPLNKYSTPEAMNCHSPFQILPWSTVHFPTQGFFNTNASSNPLQTSQDISTAALNLGNDENSSRGNRELSPVGCCQGFHYPIWVLSGHFAKTKQNKKLERQYS